MQIFPALFKQLTHQAEIIRLQATAASTEQAHWKPKPADWSLVEVINHLYDEEQFDFRTRIDYIFNRPGEDWPRIDPQGWVTERSYNQRDLADSLANFLAERQKSLAWLETLAGADWTRFEIAPWGAPLHAADLLAAWAAHDLLHIRQLNELHYQWTMHIVAPYSVDYAGEW